MKTATFLFALITSSVFAQGPLTPPAGAPAASMKTLTQVEPRTAIEALPFTISTSGSYYFTKNLQFTAASGNAISITIGNVTLDLNGFTLSSTAGVTGTAISISDNLTNLTIKNGIIAGNTTVVISGGSPQVWTPNPQGFDFGLHAAATTARNMTVESLQVSGCRSIGILADFGGVTNSTSSANGTYGIIADFGRVTGCTASLNGGGGIAAEFGSVTSSIATRNGDFGIAVVCGTVTDSAVTSNGGSYGIYALSGSVTNSTARSNRGNYGIYASSGSVSGCAATGNSGVGIQADNGSVTNSTADSNVRDGISAESGSVTHCAAQANHTSVGTFYDLDATDAVVAFTKYGTGNVTGSTLTGNKTP
ncbi:MAG: right-handed parallel beta-helix repeat-containing protein [Luteolibacter sp.]